MKFEPGSCVLYVLELDKYKQAGFLDRLQIE